MPKEKLPMETVESSTTFRVHGVNYIRTGQCIRCGECCKTKNCPHFSWKAKLATCNIQNEKDEVCTSCATNENGYWYKPQRETTHQICRVFPNHPFLRVIMSRVCGYKFEPVTEEDKIKHQKFIDTWQ